MFFGLKNKHLKRLKWKDQLFVLHYSTQQYNQRGSDVSWFYLCLNIK